MPLCLKTKHRSITSPSTGPARRGAAVGLLALATLTSACATAADTDTTPNNATSSNAVSLQASDDAVRTQPAPSFAGSYIGARVARHAGDLETAARLLREIIDAEPQNLGLKRDLFLVDLGDGNVAAAVTLAGDLKDDRRAPAFVPVALAIEDIHASRFADARARLKALPQRGLNLIVGPLLEAWALAGEKNTAAALAMLKPLEKNRGFRATAILHRALILDLAGKTADAEAAFAEAEAAGGISLRLAELTGGFYARTGRAAEADAVYARYRDAQPASSLIDPALAAHEGSPERIDSVQDGVAEALFGIGNSLRQEAAREAALMFGYLALYLRPDFDLARVMIGDTLDSADRLEQAVAAYGEIAPTSPYAWPARLRTASALDRMHDTDAAIALLGTLAAERPDNAQPMINLGDILRSHQRYGEAADAYGKAVGRITTVERQHWTLFYSRGIALERSRRWPEAEKDFLKALELEPDQPYVLNYLGYSWVDQGIDLERGRELIERAVSLRPDDGYIIDSLGWALFKLGDYAGAVRELERAVELRPEDPTINDHLGDAYWHVNRTAEARFQWRRALSFNPDEENIAAIEAKLRSDTPTVVVQRSND